MISLALMKTDMLRYTATTVAYVADYVTPCRVDMGNVGSVVLLGISPSPQPSPANGRGGKAIVFWGE